MNLSRFDRLAIGLVLVLGIFSLELTSQLSGLLYLISAIYILRFSGPSKQALILAVATTLSIILGYFFANNDEAISARAYYNPGRSICHRLDLFLRQSKV